LLLVEKKRKKISLYFLLIHKQSFFHLFSLTLLEMDVPPLVGSQKIRWIVSVVQLAFHAGTCKAEFHSKNAKWIIASHCRAISWQIGVP
jgi:hypothetical protein